MGSPEGDAVDKSLVVVRGPLGEGDEGMQASSLPTSVTNGAGVPGARIITDGAQVWMNIATN